MNVGEDKKKAPRIVRGAGVVCLRVVLSSGSVGRFDLLGGCHGIKMPEGFADPRADGRSPP